jgi:hypothetical protein
VFSYLSRQLFSYASFFYAISESLAWFSCMVLMLYKGTVGKLLKTVANSCKVSPRIWVLVSSCLFFFYEYEEQ